MIRERSPGEKEAYADGFKEAIRWFETMEADPTLVARGRALHAIMLAMLDPPPQELPAHVLEIEPPFGGGNAMATCSCGWAAEASATKAPFDLWSKHMHQGPTDV